MHKLSTSLPALLVFLLPLQTTAAAPRSHSVVLGPARKAVYSPATSAPAATTPGAVLRVRPLMIDGRLREWTTGDSHDVTDRSFAIRRAVRVNDSLPGESAQRWIWQAGAWLLVDRQTGHITLLHLPDYDPAISEVTWFRDYAAYCGISSSAKTLFAIVARAGTTKALVQKEIQRLQNDAPLQPACSTANWARDPVRVTFHPAGHDAFSFELSGATSAVLEEAPDNDD